MHLEGVEGIQLNIIQKDVKSNYAYFPVIFEEKLFGASRAEVFDKLAENGIGARKYFYPLTNTSLPSMVSTMCLRPCCITY